MADLALLDQTLTALADPARRHAVELLGGRPRRAGELAAEVGVSPSVMSRHLRVLRSCGLVAETHPEYDARVRIYSLQSAPMAALRSWLAATEQGWADQLSALRSHLSEST